MKVKPINHPDWKEQRLLALWAADCAEHVLPLFEKRHPQDVRPRQAIAAARAWERGEIKCAPARTAALAAHAAARSADNEAARQAARAAAHAAGTAHMAGHSQHAADYAIKAVVAAATEGVAAKEREWQSRRLPEQHRPTVLAENHDKSLVIQPKKDKLNITR